MGGKIIGPAMSGCLIGVALLFDGLQFLLTLTGIGAVLSGFVALIAWLLFLAWFALLGVNYLSGGANKLIAAGASMVTELIPLVDTLPALTLGVTAIIIQHNTEVRKKQNLPANSRNNRRLAIRAHLMARRAGLAKPRRPAAPSEEA